MSSKSRQATEPKGFKLRRIGIGFMIVSLLFVLFSVYSIIRVRQTHFEIAQTNDSYANLQDNASAMETASELLTESVRGFVTTGENKYLDSYFEEKYVTKRRDKALELIYASPYETAISYLQAAVEYSVNLEKTECYAMALYLSADHTDLSDYPQVLQEVQLSEEDKALSAMRKIAKAQAIVYNTDYVETRKHIQANVTACKESLLQEVLAQQLVRENKLDRLLWLQTVLIILVFILIFGILFCIWRLILSPLHDLHTHIQNQTPLPLNGAYELQYVSSTYNDVFEENLQIREKLDYEASHDALTGLQNRRRFDAKRVLEKNRTMVIIDVDNFKHFNDTYGHDVGDQVLKKVGSALLYYFRHDDGIYRIGGDEFAIIMKDVTSKQQSQLEERFKSLQKSLQETHDGIPSIFVSIGVALSDRMNGSANPLKDADMALYQVKEHGRNGYAFYNA
ncbi:MAG: diguanylate cyclase [Clostridia bacterium]|nr:diguanylate cyclase [Clostridia bacterium]